MTPPQKPEWIEIADNDNSVLPRKISKGLPVMALAVTASIIGIGSIFAQTAQESPASAIEFTAPAVQSSQSDDTVEPFAPEAATVSNTSFTPQSATAISPSDPTIINPSIGTMPSGSGEDDDYGDDEGIGDDDEGDDD